MEGLLEEDDWEAVGRVTGTQDMDDGGLMTEDALEEGGGPSE